MKGLVTYINEAIKKLERNVKGIIVFDIDDTLLQADDKIIKIYKTILTSQTNPTIPTNQSYNTNLST